MAVNGTQVLLLVKNGATFVPVAEQQSLSIESSINLIEANSKSSDHAKYIYGKQEGSLSLEALYVPNDESHQALRDAMKDRQTIIVRRKEGDQEVEEAEALIETMSHEYPDDDVATISVDLTLNSDWTPVVVA